MEECSVIKIKSTLVTLSLLIVFCACSPSASNPSQGLETATPFPLPPTWTPVHSLDLSPTETVTAETVNVVSIEPTGTIPSTEPVAYEIPVFPGAQDVGFNFLESMTDKPGNTVYYAISATPAEVETFYMEELIREGWAWVYTDSGESLTETLLSPSMMMEFQKEGRKLGIAVHGFGGGLIVLAGTDVSGGQLTAYFVGMVSGGLDWMGPSEIDARPDAMHFSSTLVEFSHPFQWLVTDKLMEIYDTDAAVNYRAQKNFCKPNMEICFVNFWVGNHFDIPISIRTHTEMTGLTLEEAATRHWEELASIAAAPNKRYYFPEELAVEGSLQSLEVHLLTLADGTPAIQRMYQWKQEDVVEPIISTSTLFVSGVLLMEFHTDFIKEEWEKQQTTVNQVIAGISTVP
jgi:hypothetical protein